MPPASAINVKNGKFFDGTTPWRPIGVNYFYPTYALPFYRHASWDWVLVWGAPEFPGIDAEAEIASDFALMQAKGINEIRLAQAQVFVAKDLDPATYPTPARSYCARLNRLLDLAGQSGLHVTLLLPVRGHASTHNFGVASSMATAETFMSYAVRVISACGLSSRSELMGYAVDGEGEVEFPSADRFQNRGEPVSVKLWNEWLVDRYGSIARAESKLGITFERECTTRALDNNGRRRTNGCPDLDEWDTGCTQRSTQVCPPRLSSGPDGDVTDGGLTSKWPAVESDALRAFARFADWVMNRRFMHIREILKKVDPYHLLATDSLLADTYCSKAIYLQREQTKYLDYTGVHVYHHQYPHPNVGKHFSTANYGMGPDFEFFKSSALGIAYMNPARRPVMIGEVGLNILDCAAMPKGDDGGITDNFCVEGNAQQRESIQADHHAFERAVSASGGARGYRWWWWRGQRPMGGYDALDSGVRDGELSDYGVRRPDGGQRSILNGFASSAAVFAQVEGATPVVVNVTKGPGCVRYVLSDAGRALASFAVNQGRPLRVDTQCSGTSTADAPVTCIEGGTYFSSCPPGDSEHCCPTVCLDAMFEKVDVRGEDGAWVDAREGRVVRVAKNSPLQVRVRVGNTGESSWDARAKDGGTSGTARLALTGTGLSINRVNLASDVASFDSTPDVTFSPVASVTGPMTFSMRLVAEGRLFFGESAQVQVDVAP